MATNDNQSADDKESASSQKQKAKNQRETELNDIRFLLKHAQGRRVLWRYMEEAKVFHSTFTGNSKTFLLEGKRQIGLLVLEDIMEADPDAFVNMIIENRSDSND